MSTFLTLTSDYFANDEYDFKSMKVYINIHVFVYIRK